MLSKDGKYKPAKVVGRATTSNGTVASTYDANSMLNTMTYNVKFQDGDIQKYLANIIPKHLLNQIDDDSFMLLKLDTIVDHCKDHNAVTCSDMYTTLNPVPNRLERPQFTDLLEE